MQQILGPATLISSLSSLFKSSLFKNGSSATKITEEPQLSPQVGFSAPVVYLPELLKCLFRLSSLTEQFS